MKSDPWIILRAWGYALRLRIIIEKNTERNLNHAPPDFFLY